MTLVEKTHDELLRDILFERLVRDDILIPAHHDTFFKWGFDEKGKLIFAPNEQYIRELGWFLHVDPRVVAEALINAFGRGNHYNPSLSVRVSLYEGLEGQMVKIEDSGNGFDHQSLIQRIKEKLPYKCKEGFGTKWLDQPGFFASYQGDGNIIDIQASLLYFDD